MSKQSQSEHKKNQRKIITYIRVAIIGIFGGGIWSLLGFVFYTLNFSKFGPALILAPFPAYHWKESVGKQFLGILLICIVSIFIAFAYKLTLSRIKNLWISVGFGLVLWVIVFYILQPWISGLDPVTELGKNTISTTLCLYALYGLFVGYSISFDINSHEDEDTDYSNE
ncbi:H+/Cl- antiporter ClcA [Pullulanibacillus pueri]|uniref:Uncharacterized protein n=1 Tax=Pullulanibacillus pueri TaxID=1437324 RepID=A0A8J3ELM1_9BACL|nr:YqhR family membrane protein [Pullulanibacillus pueri]MBM7681581.1 H+/Cl- antiporter ClcA [Pullulanibacillus pueri]GGH79586.1 hypothetical protein GCM10007096_14730 [Pullulanibacillus pueri]